MLDEQARERTTRVRFAKPNVDENPVTASRFRAGSIPTPPIPVGGREVLVGGREVDRLVGLRPKAEIERRLRAAAG